VDRSTEPYAPTARSVTLCASSPPPLVVDLERQSPILTRLQIVNDAPADKRAALVS
jgi:hypothetical protein